MKPKDMIQKIVTEINSDNIGCILNHTQEAIKDHIIALRVLVALNKLLYNAVHDSISCESSIDDIVQLFTLCCEVIIKNWNPSINKVKVYRSLFHINNYILFKEHVLHLEDFYKFIFLIHDKPSEEKNTEEENTILKSFISYMIMHINKSLNKFCHYLVDENEVSLLKICKLLFKLDHLCDFGANEMCLKLVIRVSQVCQGTGHPDLLFFLKECFNFLTPQSVTNYEKLVQLIYCFLSQIIHSQPPIPEVKFLLDFIRTFENSVKGETNLFRFCINIIRLLMCKLEDLQFMKTAEECNSILIKWICKKEISTGFYNICSCSIFTLMKIHKYWFVQIAQFNLASDKLKTIFDLFNNFYNIFKMESNEICTLLSGEKCPLKSDVVNLIHCQYLIFTLISSCKREQADVSMCYPVAMNAQRRCIKWINEAKNKQCPKLDSIASWAYTAMVRVSRWLQRTDDLKFIEITFESMLQLPKEVVHTQDFTMKGLSLVACLSDNLQKNGRLDKSLKALVAFLYVWPDSESHIFSFWVDLKHNQMLTGCEEYMNLTVHDIVENKSEQDWVELYFTNSKIVKYLCTEIKFYYKNSLHRTTHLILAFNELRKRTGDAGVISEALAMAMEVSSSSEKFLMDMKKHQELSNQLLPMLKEKVLKKSNAFKLEFLIGDLVFQQFRCDLRLTRNKSEREISLSAAQKDRVNSKSHPIEDINPDDKCQVDPVYETLSINTQQNMLKKIDEAFIYWKSASIKIMSDVYVGEPNQIDVTLENIWSACLMYKLFCEEEKKITLLHFLYKLADFVSCHGMKILAISELLEADSNLPSECVEDCIEDIIKQNIKPKIKLAFQISYVKYCLSNNNKKEGISVLNELNEQWKTYSVTLISAQLKMNKFSDILSATDCARWFAYDVVGLQVVLQMCLSYMNKDNEYRNFSELSQIHDIGLQSSHDIGMVYWNIRLPRLARCYLKAQITIAQKLVLPLRTAQLLSILTWVDLDCRNATDAAIKLQGLEAILDMPSSGELAKASTSSPDFQRSSISLPDFVKHEHSCKCFPCTSDEYQRLVLVVIALRGEYDGLIGENKKALDDFKVGMKVLDKIYKNRTKSYFLLDKSRVDFWIKYAELQTSLGNYTGAIETYNRAKSFLNPKDESNLIKILQMLPTLPSFLIKKAAKIKAPVITISSPDRTGNFKIPKDIEEKKYKTPTNLYKRTGFEKSPLSVLNNRITPRRPARALFLCSSDEDNSDAEVSKENKPVAEMKPMPLSNRKTKLLPDIVILSPSAILSSIKKDKNTFTVFSDEVGSSVPKTYARSRRINTKEVSNVSESNSLLKTTGARRKLMNDDDIDVINSRSAVKNTDTRTKRKDREDTKAIKPTSLIKKSYTKRQLKNADETGLNEPSSITKKNETKTHLKKKEILKSETCTLERRTTYTRKSKLNKKETTNLNEPGSSKLA